MDAEPDHSCAVAAVSIPICCAIGHGDHYQIRAIQSAVKPAQSLVEIVAYHEEETESVYNVAFTEDARV